MLLNISHKYDWKRNTCVMCTNIRIAFERSIAMSSSRPTRTIRKRQEIVIIRPYV